jgi:hypothetical protein
VITPLWQLTSPCAASTAAIKAEGIRLAGSRRTRQRHRGDAGADAALVGARLFDRNKALWASFVLGDAGGKDLHRLRFRLWRGQAFSARGREARPLRLAILPIGA